MCGRFSLFSVQAILTRWDAVSDEPIIPRYNIAPGQDILMIGNDYPGRLTEAKWGLIPHWSKDPKIGFRTINAKAETLEEKPAFKEPFMRHRCLIPADGFYEWKETPSGKVPYRFTLKDESLFAFAGIFDLWKDDSGNLVKSVSIVTVEPNDLVKPIHDRMPAVLKKEHEDMWLGKASTSQLREVILKPYPAEEMRCYEVSSKINSSKDDMPEMILPAKDSQKKSLLDF
jgi:putative SOS response-associated peptidase YedK